MAAKKPITHWLSQFLYLAAFSCLFSGFSEGRYVLGVLGFWGLAVIGYLLQKHALAEMKKQEPRK